MPDYQGFPDGKFTIYSEKLKRWFETPESRDHYERLEEDKSRRAADSSLDGVSPQEIRDIAENELYQKEWHERFTGPSTAAAVRVFLQDHPAIMDSVENGETLRLWLLQKKLSPSYENFELAVADLGRRGMLELNQAEVDKLQEQAVREQRDAGDAANLSEELLDQLNDIPIDQWPKRFRRPR